MRHPKLKVDVYHSDVGLKIMSEVVHTCPNYNNNFIDEPFKISWKPKTFKPPLFHKLKRLKSRIYDPMGVIDHERLDKLQAKLRRQGLTNAQKRRIQ